MKYLLMLALLSALTVPAHAGRVTGTFIQLNRGVADKPVPEWAADLDRMKEAGINTLIVQWCAEGDLAYFKSDLPFGEQHATIENLLAAADGKGFRILLGLRNDPDYWKQITARDRVLRDYFMARVAQNEAVQLALKAKFDRSPDFAGYYIPDEIDDLNWRTPSRRALMKEYLAVLARRLKANDPDRPATVSSFVRGRTAPDIYANTLKELFASDSHVDAVLIQDGVGVGDPPASYVALYFKELQQRWDEQGPQLWGIVEAFEQTSKAGEAFAARPAPAGRLRKQVEAAAPYFDRLVLFTFLDYATPAKGPEAEALFDVLKETR